MHEDICILLLTNMTGINENPHVKQPFNINILNYWYTEPDFCSKCFFHTLFFFQIKKYEEGQFQRHGDENLKNNFMWPETSILTSNYFH